MAHCTSNKHPANKTKAKSRCH